MLEAVDNCLLEIYSRNAQIFEHCKDNFKN